MLLNIDYKLLTKVLTNRLFMVRLSVLHKAHLFFVRARNIMPGAISLWPAAELIRQQIMTVFMVNLDFYHAYERVCLPYVVRVLAAISFGDIIREVENTLHRDVSASFLLCQITRAEPILYLLGQRRTPLPCCWTISSFCRFCSTWRMFCLVSPPGF
jgi:hypothetical protein